MKQFRVFKKAVGYGLLTIVSLLSILFLSVLFFKDQIIQQFITELNKSLNTPVKIEHIDVSVFDHFPNLSIVCSNVYVEDSHLGEYPLFTAKTVSFQLNPIKVWKGEYYINGLSVVTSKTHLKTNKKGQNNFIILKEDIQSTEKKSMNFSLKNVQIRQASLVYTDEMKNQDFNFQSNELIASIDNTSEVYQIDLIGYVTVNHLQVKNSSFFDQKEMSVKIAAQYHNKQKQITIEKGELEINRSTFTILGNYKWGTKNFIDISCGGKDTDIQTMLSLLPTGETGKLQRYKSKGEVYFNARIKGVFDKKNNPSVSIDFGFKDATISHPDYQLQIEKANLTGSYANSNFIDVDAGVLILKNISGELNQEPFQADLIFQNISDPNVILKFKGKINVETIQNIYPIRGITHPKGHFFADVSFEGKPSWLKSKTTAQQTTAMGSIEFNNISFQFEHKNLFCKNLNGWLHFNNNDLAFSNTTLQIGRSDFTVNGFFKNIISYLILENQPIEIEADLQSKYIDANELLGIDEKNTNKGFSFGISPHIQINFQCDIKHLAYQRLHAQQLQGDLMIRNQMAASRNLTCNTMGGSIVLNGIVDAKQPTEIDVVSSFKLKNIQIDSLFYVFENFQQNFIKDNQLRGFSNAEVELEMRLTEKLNLIPETLIADASMVIQKGELNDFEPIQKLKKYLDDEGLSKLRFAELKNDIHIENQTIYIPQMEIRTNVTTLQLSGTHTFDQKIDYRISVPLINKKKIDITEAGEALEEKAGKTKLFLKITGTTSDYKIQYDKEAVKNKITSDLKKEVQELKDAFKQRGNKKKKEIEVTDEVFDWELHPNNNQN